MGSGLTFLVGLLLVASVLAPPPPPGRPVDDSNSGLKTNKVRNFEWLKGRHTNSVIVTDLLYDHLNILDN